MQRIANCILTTEDQCLMLQKPSRGWWVAPGGKMEQTETIKEAAIREFREETGLQIEAAVLRAVTTIVIVDDKQQIMDEWMMFTFSSSNYSGTMLKESPEGKLVWQDLEAHSNLPMAPGDHFVFDHVLTNEGILYGTFYYTEDYKLVKYRLDPLPASREEAVQ